MFIDGREATNPHAREVLAILRDGHYESESGARVEIASAQAAAEAGTALYTPDALTELRTRAPLTDSATLKVEVSAATSQEAAANLGPGDVALLNYASARNPGGGFLGGAKAQEEELCRCSGLYRTLLTQPRYYEVHRRDRSLLYSDHVIYSPRVPFFRIAADAPFLDRPLLCSVITAPAPNAGAIARNQPERTGEIPEVLERRWANVFAIAETHGHRLLVVGAWGCGAFRNDPEVVATAAKRALAQARFSASFDRVVFAIPAVGERSRTNLERFRAVLG